MFDEIDPIDYRETMVFVECQAAIEAIIHLQPPDEKGNSGTITIRGIHERLGFRSRPHWTIDALAGLKSIEPIGVMITRYRARSGHDAKFKERWTGDGMRWIFAGKRSQKREIEFSTSAR